MARAIWNGAILAESDAGIAVEGTYYFPPEAVNRQYLTESSTQTTCAWKGRASYYDLVVDGQVNRDAAWYYPSPRPEAERIKSYVAFWRGVQVEA